MSAKTRRTLAGGLLAIGLLSVTPAWAAIEGVPQAYQAGARAIVHMSKGQAKILKAWKTPAGLDGYGVQIAPGRNVIIYTTPDGHFMFMGGLFDAKTGKNLSVEYGEKYLPAGSVPKPITPAKVAADLDKTTNFLVGKPDAKKSLWIVMDPNCIFCHKAWEAFYPLVQKGDLNIHVIPVGFLKPSSLPKAATVIASKDPAKAWALDEKGFNDADEEGGLKPMASIPSQDRLDIQKNTAWMNAHGINGTPFILYQTQTGWGAIPGLPQDIPAFMAQVK